MLVVERINKMKIAIKISSIQTIKENKPYTIIEYQTNDGTEIAMTNEPFEMVMKKMKENNNVRGYVGYVRKTRRR